MNVEKKWILVTGASSGIGRATVLNLIDDGFSVIACSRNREDLEREFTAFSAQQMRIYPFDLSHVQNIESFAKKINNDLGAIHGLVHCAAIQRTLAISMASEEKINEIFSLNTFAAIELVRVFSKNKMCVKKGTSFVLISSQSAHEGSVGNSIYAASKGALEGFLAPAASELVRRNIRLNIVIPGLVDTRMSQAFTVKLSDVQRSSLEQQFPLGIGQPENISQMISFLISERSSWTTGQTFTVDGGHSICF